MEVGHDDGRHLHRNAYCPSRVLWTVPVIDGTALRLLPGVPATVGPPNWHDCQRWPVPREEWREYAACRDEGMEFLESDMRSARRLCLRCPVAVWCLITALNHQRHNYYDGFVWAGLDPAGRHRLRSWMRDGTASRAQGARSVETQLRTEARAIAMLARDVGENPVEVVSEVMEVPPRRAVTLLSRAISSGA